MNGTRREEREKREREMVEKEGEQGRTPPPPTPHPEILRLKQKFNLMGFLLQKIVTNMFIKKTYSLGF